MGGQEPKLTAAGLRALRIVCQMPLISTHELARFQGVVYSTASRHLDALEANGWVDGATMGAAIPAARRYRLTPAGAGLFTESQVYSHSTRPLNRLARRLPVVEALYSLVLELPRLAGFEEFQSFDWRYSERFDAMVRYANGRCIVIWSGPWRTRKGLLTRLETIVHHAAENDYWPDLYCIAASDPWQAHLAAETIGDLRMTESFLVVCVQTLQSFGSHHPKAPPLPYGPNPLFGHPASVIPDQWAPVMGSPLSGPESHMNYRILRQLENVPGSLVATVARALGSHPRNVSPKVKRLLDEDLLVQSGGHLYLTQKALDLFAQRDRVHVSRPRRRFGPRGDGLPSVARVSSHDGAAAAVLAVFQERGFPVAGGWRGEDYSGGKDAVAPDAIIFMGHGSSGGEGWHCLEYERRAGSVAMVAAKLKGYIARGSRFPVLVAAQNEAMAAEFRRQADAAGLRLWAASIPEIRIEKPETIAGEATVWVNAAGQRAVFLPPSFGSYATSNQGSRGIFAGVEAAEPLGRTGPVEIILEQDDDSTGALARFPEGAIPDAAPAGSAASRLHRGVGKWLKRWRA